MRWPLDTRFAAATGPGVLGQHDGIGFWRLHTARIEDHDMQGLVSVHERLHHDLVMSTPWGLLTSALGTLAESRPGTTTFEDMFLRACGWSTIVHETYATYFSVGPNAALVEKLDGDYLGYYRRADEFCPDPTAGWLARSVFAHATLTATMAPPELAAILARHPARWHPGDLHALGENRPDRRWERAWQRREQLWDAFDGRGLDAEPPDQARTTEIVARFAPALEDAGVACLDPITYRALAERLAPRLTEIAGAAAGYEVVAYRRDPARADLEEQQREGLVFRDAPLHAVPVGPDLAASWRDFAAHHPDLGLHTVLYWLRADLLDRQLDAPHARTAQTLALMSVAPDPEERREVLLWTMGGALGLDPVARIFTEHRQRLIVVTTLATLADAPPTATSRHVERLYALVDLPVVPVLDAWVQAQAEVRWHSCWVDGGHPLYVFVFDVSVNPGVVLVHVTSRAGRTVLLRWLFETHPETFIRDSGLGDAVQSEVDCLIQHVTASWWFHDHRAGHPPTRSDS